MHLSQKFLANMAVLALLTPNVAIAQGQPPELTSEIALKKIIEFEKEGVQSIAHVKQQESGSTQHQEDINENGITFSLNESETATLSAPEAPGPFKEIFFDGELWTMDNQTIYRDINSGAAAYRILKEDESSAEWELDLPEGVFAHINENGEVEFRNETKGLTVRYGTIFEKPWAIDTTGSKVSTWYELHNNGKLVQHVDRSKARGDIIMDPKISYGRGVYLNAWGKEMRLVHQAAVGATNAAFLATCAVDKLPSALKLIAAPLCMIGGVNALDIVNAVKSVPRYIPGTCYQIKVIRYKQGTRPRPVGAHECS